MLRENNSIIVVDDEEGSLHQISKEFNKFGIGCRTFLCDGFNLPEKPLHGVKIAFFDINYNTTGDDKALFANLKNIIASFVSKDNGPYILVFWTTHPEQVNDFVSFVNRDDGYKDIANPIDIKTLDKTKFALDENLLQDLEAICSSPLATCLFSFQEEMLEASTDCFEKLMSFAKSDEEWGKHDKFEKKIKELFSRIAYESSGFLNGRSSPDKAIKEAVAPILLYHLLTNGSISWANYLNISEKEVEFFKNIEIDHIAPHLNSYFHIDPIVTDSQARGVVRYIDCDDNYFETRMGFSKDKWVREIFFDKKANLSGSYDIIAIGISAACDYAQNKIGTHKYIIGILLDDADYKNIAKKCRTISESLAPLFLFHFNGNNKGIIINNNMMISEENTDIFGILGTPKFLLKHEILNFIIDRLASHISRLGFTKF